MRSFRLRQAEYPLVGLAMRESFVRDQAEFQTYYKSMGEEFLNEFDKAIAGVQGVHSTSTGMYEQKDASARVYELQEDLYRKTMFMKDYVNHAGLDVKPVNEAIKSLRKSDTEAAVKAVRQAVVYYQPFAEQLTDMPDGFADSMATDADALKARNNEQNTAMNFRTNLTAENRAKYVALDKIIKKVSNAGKRIYKGTPKANEYTVSHLLSRIRTSQRPAGEAPAPDIVPVNE